MYAASSAASVTDPSCPMPFASSSADSELTSMLNDCPPSKPISIRTCSAMCHHLRENAVDGIRMDERDLQTEHPGARLFVDELCAVAPQPLERRRDVLDLERDVVHSGAARGEEAADRGVVLERREQLDAAAADEDGRRLDALAGHRRTVLQLRAEEPLVRPQRLVEVVDGYADVMNAARFHSRDGSRVSRPRAESRARRGRARSRARAGGPAQALTASSARQARSAASATSTCSGVGSFVA